MPYTLIYGTTEVTEHIGIKQKLKDGHWPRLSTMPAFQLVQQVDWGKGRKSASRRGG